MQETTNKDMQTFDVRLKNYRNMRGWSIRFITDELNIPYQNWQRWEKGRGLPAEHWQKLLLQKLMTVGLPLGGE